LNSGRGRQKYFYVSDDGSELCWCNVNYVSPQRLEYSKDPLKFKTIPAQPDPDQVILLADVETVVFGPRTDGFGAYGWNEKSPFNCFSLVLPEETVDIECPDRNTFMTWFMGLQYLTPLSFQHLSRGMVCWYRAYVISLIKAKEMGMNVQEYWKVLVQQAKTATSVKVKAKVPPSSYLHQRRLSDITSAKKFNAIDSVLQSLSTGSTITLSSMLAAEKSEKPADSKENVRRLLLWRESDASEMEHERPSELEYSII
jgi:hypothetical protein